MTQKERVSNLFGFLMDLLEEPSTEVDSSIKPPHHENNLIIEEKEKKGIKLTDQSNFFNPLTQNGKDTLHPDIDRIKDVMGKIAEKDKERAWEGRVHRKVDDATRPLKEYINELREKAVAEAFVEKTKEEMVETNEDQVGMTLVDGKLTAVKIPKELRDNMPLGSNFHDGPIAVKVKQDDAENITGFDSLPPEVRKLLKADVLMSKDDELEEDHTNAIDDAMRYKGPGVPPQNFDGKLGNNLPDEIRKAMMRNNKEDNTNKEE